MPIIHHFEFWPAAILKGRDYLVNPTPDSFFSSKITSENQISGKSISEEQSCQFSAFWTLSGRHFETVWDNDFRFVPKMFFFYLLCNDISQRGSFHLKKKLGSAPLRGVPLRKIGGPRKQLPLTKEHSPSFKVLSQFRKILEGVEGTFGSPCRYSTLKDVFDIFDTLAQCALIPRKLVY